MSAVRHFNQSIKISFVGWMISYQNFKADIGHQTETFFIVKQLPEQQIDTMIK